MSQITVTVWDTDFVVTYDYYGGEPAYVSDYDGGHPGCVAEVCIERVSLEAAKAVDIYGLLSESVIEAIEETILRHED